MATIENIEIIQDKLQPETEVVTLRVGDHVKLTLTEAGKKNDAATDVPPLKREGRITQINVWDGNFEGVYLDSYDYHQFTPKCWHFEVIPVPLPKVGEEVTVRYNFGFPPSDVEYAFYSGTVRSVIDGKEFVIEDVDILFVYEDGHTETVRGNLESHFTAECVRKGKATWNRNVRRYS